MPWVVVDYLAGQLGIEDPSVVKRYTERVETANAHTREIRTAYGYRDLAGPVAEDLSAFCDSRAWTHGERPTVLFEHAAAWLRRERVLLPGVTTLVRVVQSAREAAQTRLYEAVATSADGFDPGLSGRLHRLLTVDQGERVSRLEVLRAGPTRLSGRELNKALGRVDMVRALGTGAVDLSGLSPTRVRALAKLGRGASTYTLRRLGEPRRTATLVATVAALEADAVDKVEVLDAAWAGMSAAIDASGPDASVRLVESEDGKAKLSVSPLNALEIPASLKDLRVQVAGMLPRVDLPEILLEVHSWTGFLDSYTHLSGAGPRMSDLPLSVAAVLIAQACNVGLTPVTSDGHPALTRDRLGHVDANYVRAYDVLRMLTRENGSPNPLGAAITEYGRIAKTIHLLALIDPTDETYRRAINTQLTVQESRHRLARAIFHGLRGRIYQRYREGQEDQLGALGLVLNAVVLWNTRYIDAALVALREAGQEISEPDVARLSPLGNEHINMLGRYAFTAPIPSGLRQLRDPSASELERAPRGRG